MFYPVLLSFQLSQCQVATLERLAHATHGTTDTWSLQKRIFDPFYTSSPKNSPPPHPDIRNFFDSRVNSQNTSVASARLGQEENTNSKKDCKKRFQAPFCITIDNLQAQDRERLFIPQISLLPQLS